MKKLLEIIMTLAIAMQGMCAFAAEDENIIYVDDFSSYADASVGKTFGKLKTNGKSGGTVGSNLAIESISDISYLKVPAGIAEEQVRKCTVANYTETILGDKMQLISVDFEKQRNIMSGVRFYKNDDMGNYYELNFPSGVAWSLVQCVEDERTTLQQSNVKQPLINGIYHLEILFDNKDISWRAEDENGNLKTINQTLDTDWQTIEVDSPFEIVENNFALIACGGINDYAKYTNLSVSYSEQKTPGATDWIFEFEDKFDTYDLDLLKPEIGPWKSNGKTGSLQALTSNIMVMEKSYAGEKKNALCVPSTELYSNPTAFTAAELQMPIVTGGKAEYGFMFKKDSQMVDSFRFMIHNNGLNYYEITFSRDGNSEPGWSLIKSVNGGRTALVTGAASKNLGSTDYKVKIGYDYEDYTGIISWNIVRCDGANPQYEGGMAVTNASGKYEDLYPFKNVGTSTVALVSGGQNAKYSYFADFYVKATESKEEAPLDENDPESLKAYIERQNTLIAPYNDAVQQESVSKMVSFLIDGGKLSLARMDKIGVNGLDDLDNDDLYAYAERLINYGDTIKFENLDDLKKFEDRLNAEIIIGQMDNAETADDLAELIDKNAALFGITLDSYYETMKENIAGAMLEQNLLNAEDFKEKLTEAIIMENYKYTANDKYFRELLEKNSGKIGYDVDHYSKIDCEGLAKDILTEKVKDTINDLESLKKYIDEYNKKPTEPEPTPTPKPKRTSGGGGGGGSSVPFVSINTSAPSGDSDAIVSVTPPVVVKNILYDDVPTEHWSYEAVRYLTAKKAASGYEDGTFQPDKMITRAEFLTMLLGVYDLTNNEDEETDISFSDVSQSSWYYNNIMCAAKIGILKGDNGMAYPDRNITRQEIAALICRVMEYKNITLNASTPLVRFADDDQVDGWAFQSVKSLQAAGVINGYNGYFCPKNHAKRSEVAQMLYLATSVTEREVSADA